VIRVRFLMAGLDFYVTWLFRVRFISSHARQLVKLAHCLLIVTQYYLFVLKY